MEATDTGRHGVVSRGGELRGRSENATNQPLLERLCPPYGLHHVKPRCHVLPARGFSGDRYSPEARPPANVYPRTPATRVTPPPAPVVSPLRQPPSPLAQLRPAHRREQRGQRLAAVNSRNDPTIDLKRIKTHPSHGFDTTIITELVWPASNGQRSEEVQRCPGMGASFITCMCAAKWLPWNHA